MANADICESVYHDGDAHLGREGFWAHGEVTPPREEPHRRLTDASRLTFPLQLVVVIIGGIVGTTGAFWISTSQIRSDVRDMATRQQDEARVRDIERKLSDERYESFKKAIDEIKSAQKLEEIRNQEMRVTIAGMGGRTK